MPQHTLREDEDFSSEVIRSSMFGANYVTIYDYEISDNPELIFELSALGISTLRYPGGSVTESSFAEACFLTGNWEAETFIRDNGSEVDLTTLSEFFTVAGRIGASAQLVVPTRVAFEETAVDALASGTYGSRNQIGEHYFEHLTEFIDTSLALARDHGVELSALEIGNEFWGSGEMTAAEYGFVAGSIVNFLAAEYPELDVITQITASAGAFSPVHERTVYLEPNETGSYSLHWANDYRGAPPRDWIVATIPACGNAITQTTAIAEQFSNLGAAQNISGVAHHVYFNGGFSGIDEERNFALNVIKGIFEEAVGLDYLDMYITEWSPRNPSGTEIEDNAGNANGLHYAHTVVEAFFELAAAGVDGANFWPITFGSPSNIYRTLIDTVEEDLTFGGAAIQWLSEATVGLSPILDYEVSDNIDVHGFGSTTNLTMFVAERSGNNQSQINGSQITLDVSEVFEHDNWFVTQSFMGSSDGSFTNSHSNPIISYIDGYIGSGSILSFDLASWNLTRVTLQAITDSADYLIGAEGDDTINGDRGNDTILGNEGIDRIKGQEGNDRLFGGAGNDWISGGWGTDTLLGESGDDSIFGGGGSDLILGGSGADQLNSTDGSDLLRGGDGNDQIYLSSTGVFEGNVVATNVSSQFQIGTGVQLSIAGQARLEAVTEGGQGYDILYLSDLSDAFFLHDSLSEFHEQSQLEPDSTGHESTARFISIEEIRSGAGNDIVDFTSADYSLAGQNLTVDMGTGNDVFWGSDSNDNVNGGPGNDTIFGGTGIDRLVGGAGADTFEFTVTSRNANIVDFSPEQGDTLLFYNTENVIFDEESIALTETGISIEVSNFLSGEREVLHINLSGAAEGFDLALSEIIDAVTII